MKNLINSGFTLLEILLSSVIFIITIGGIFATLNAVRSPVAQKESSLAAAVFGKQALETLRTSVSEEPVAHYNSCSGSSSTSCPDFSLSVGFHQVSSATLAAYGLTFPASLTSANAVCGSATPCLQYTVACADGSAGPSCTNADIAHRVDLNIKW